MTGAATSKRIARLEISAACSGLSGRGFCLRGFCLIEVTLALTILGIILLGVMATITNASVAERETSEALQGQALLGQVVEEIQSTPFESLLSLNGHFVTSGEHRADITVGLAGPELVRIQVDVTSAAFPGVPCRAVLLLADTR